MTRKIYPSHISREQFKAIEELLETGKKTCSQVVDLYNIFCAILYFLREGCQWRLAWRFLATQYGAFYFNQWSARGTNEDPSLLEQALKIK